MIKRYSLLLIKVFLFSPWNCSGEDVYDIQFDFKNIGVNYYGIACMDDDSKPVKFYRLIWVESWEESNKVHVFHTSDTINTVETFPTTNYDNNTLKVRPRDICLISFEANSETNQSISTDSFDVYGLNDEEAKKLRPGEDFRCYVSEIVVKCSVKKPKIYLIKPAVGNKSIKNIFKGLAQNGIFEGDSKDLLWGEYRKDSDSEIVKKLNDAQLIKDGPDCLGKLLCGNLFFVLCNEKGIEAEATILHRHKELIKAEKKENRLSPLISEPVVTESIGKTTHKGAEVQDTSAKLSDLYISFANSSVMKIKNINNSVIEIGLHHETTRNKMHMYHLVWRVKNEKEFRSFDVENEKLKAIQNTIPDDRGIIVSMYCPLSISIPDSIVSIEKKYEEILIHEMKFQDMLTDIFNSKRGEDKVEISDYEKEEGVQITQETVKYDKLKKTIILQVAKKEKDQQDKEQEVEKVTQKSENKKPEEGKLNKPTEQKETGKQTKQAQPQPSLAGAEEKYAEAWLTFEFTKPQCAGYDNIDFRSLLDYKKNIYNILKDGMLFISSDKKDTLCVADVSDKWEESDKTDHSWNIDWQVRCKFDNKKRIRKNMSYSIQISDNDYFGKEKCFEYEIYPTKCSFTREIIKKGDEEEKENSEENDNVAALVTFKLKVNFDDFICTIINNSPPEDKKVFQQLINDIVNNELEIKCGNIDVNVGKSVSPTVESKKLEFSIPRLFKIQKNKITIEIGKDIDYFRFIESESKATTKISRETFTDFSIPFIFIKKGKGLEINDTVEEKKDILKEVENLKIIVDYNDACIVSGSSKTLISQDKDTHQWKIDLIDDKKVKYTIRVIHEIQNPYYWEGFNEFDGSVKKINVDLELKRPKFKVIGFKTTDPRTSKGIFNDVIINNIGNIENKQSLIFRSEGDSVGIPITINDNLPKTINDRDGYGFPIYLRLPEPFRETCVFEGSKEFYKVDEKQDGQQIAPAIERRCLPVNFQINCKPLDIQLPKITKEVQTSDGSKYDISEISCNSDSKSIYWPSSPQGEKILLTLAKPDGYNVKESGYTINEEGKPWTKYQCVITLEKSGNFGNINLEFTKLPAIPVIYVDLTRDEINRLKINDFIDKKVREVNLRSDANDLFVWVTDGVKRSSGNKNDYENSLKSNIIKWVPQVPNITSEIVTFADTLDTVFKKRLDVDNRIKLKYEFHLLLSQTTYRDINDNSQFKANFESLSLNGNVTFWSDDEKIEKIGGLDNYTVNHIE